MKTIILILVSLSIINAVRSPPSFWYKYGEHYKHQLKTFSEVDQYQVKYYMEQTIDHTTFTVEAQRTFSQKYLIRTKYWKGNGPIFFYCGNEGPIEMFYENSGFLNDNLAEKFNALVVYAEHRYFGESQPFGDQKTSYQKENLKYLTSEQALQDFVQFLKWFRQDTCPNCQIYAFGGSYGGMLASWLRMKYPNIVNGAVAASAPIFYFQNRAGLDTNIFFKIATSDFTHSSIGDQCPALIRETFRRVEDYKNKVNFDALNNGFKLCTPIKTSADVDKLLLFLNEGLTYMSMTNYPYETKFLKKLPGWPATTACEQMKRATIGDDDETLFDFVRKAVEVYYNYEQMEKCNEIFGDGHSSDQDMSGWEILACADMVMPMGTNGKTDMFNAQPWDSQAYTQQCIKNYGVSPNYNYTLDHYGGVVDKELLGYSNIFFSNGKLDPWSGASPLKTLSKSLPAIYMDDCSHHLDLRPPHPKDPQSVILGRHLEMLFLDTLINHQTTEYE